VTKKRMMQLAAALGAGAVGAALVISITKDELRADLATSGAELQRRLRTQGTTLQRQLRASSEAAATEAVRAEMVRLGITDSLVRDTAATVRRLNALVARFT
jgi:predicted dinucleotide-binding enzyme